MRDTPATPGGIAATPVTHAGVAMRSMTEGRWARLFDALGLRWEYEPHRYQLAAPPSAAPSPQSYLPDYWLPDLACFVEVKGAEPEGEAKDKAARLAVQTGMTCYLVVGDVAPDVACLEFAPLDPQAPDTAAWVATLREPARYGLALPAGGRWLDPGTFVCEEYGLSLAKSYGWSKGRGLFHCAQCGRVFFDALLREGGGGSCDCEAPPTEEQEWQGRPWSRYTPRLIMAYRAAAMPWVSTLFPQSQTPPIFPKIGGI